jgi:hypothetical protein
MCLTLNFQIIIVIPFPSPSRPFPPIVINRGKKYGQISLRDDGKGSSVFQDFHGFTTLLGTRGPKQNGMYHKYRAISPTLGIAL